jgi:hypothetical protein
MTLKKAKKDPLRINKSLHLKRFGWFRYEVSMKNKDSPVKFSDDENTYNLYIK